MATATITIDSLICKHASNIAYVAEMTTPATGLAEFTRHLTYAAENFNMAEVNGSDDLHSASTLLGQAAEVNGADKEPFLLRAAALLRIVPEMTDEYRDMVGD
ncbi:hypothetical protein [Streptomyces sp. NPDC058985]|uniref:hypothetical protein n=1 Tax=Streptomyces sp. NPDC058985 TaxID=3346684 RepID=UPI0036806242